MKARARRWALAGTIGRGEPGTTPKYWGSTLLRIQGALHDGREFLRWILEERSGIVGRRSYGRDDWEHPEQSMESSWGHSLCPPPRNLPLYDAFGACFFYVQDLLYRKQEAESDVGRLRLTQEMEG